MPEIIRIADPVAGTSARILAGLGFNCFEFHVPGPDGPLDVLWSNPNFPSGAERPSGSGIPLLFPFPGRIRGGELEWAGSTYKLETTDGRGNAIHGFVYDRPWRVLEHSTSRVTAEFHAMRDDPDLLKRWPADFRITASYRLSGTTLRGEYLIQNPEARPLPCGFGTHPYFRLPQGSDADACRVHLPVRSCWEMDDLIPTGRQTDWPLADQYESGIPFGDLELDTVFGNLITGPEGRTLALVQDPGSDMGIMQSADNNFTAYVAYTPPHREAVCIEPYTCIPDPIRLRASGHETGLRVLNSGESFRAIVEITARNLASG